jgi:hypothetical protein
MVAPHLHHHAMPRNHPQLLHRPMALPRLHLVLVVLLNLLQRVAMLRLHLDLAVLLDLLALLQPELVLCRLALWLSLKQSHEMPLLRCCLASTAQVFRPRRQRHQLYCQQARLLSR